MGLTSFYPRDRAPTPAGRRGGGGGRAGRRGYGDNPSRGVLLAWPPLRCAEGMVYGGCKRVYRRQNSLVSTRFVCVPSDLPRQSAALQSKVSRQKLAGWPLSCGIRGGTIPVSVSP